MTNIEIFKAISGLLFAKLYDNFPLDIVIVPSKLAVELGDEYWENSLKQNPEHENVSEFIRNRSPASISKPTIEWLKSSGLITYEKYADNAFHGVCLTAKGLESIESDKERGNKFIQAAKDITNDALQKQAKKQLNNLFSEVITWSVEKSPTIVQAITNYASQ